MQARNSVEELRELDAFMGKLFEGLCMAPGSIFRIASQYLPYWGVQVTDENRGWIETQADRSYQEEWSGGTGESNDAIARAIRKADLRYGNKDLNTALAKMAVDILDSMNNGKRTFTICDIGAGKGDTTMAVLDRLDMHEETRRLAQFCTFYLMEPSVDRLHEAHHNLRTHRLAKDCRFEWVGASHYTHLPRMAKGSFDMIISSAVFHHMPFPTYLRQIREKLAEDGVMVSGDWFTTIWMHPAFLLPVLEALGANEEKIQMFSGMFNVGRGDVDRLEKALTPQQREANKKMFKYVAALAEELSGVGSESKLCLFEGHESLDDRLGKMKAEGFVTDIEELREKHKGFVQMSSSVKQLYETHDIACVVAAAKRAKRAKRIA